MFQRKCVWSRTYRRAIACIYVHFDKFCPADVLIVLGEGFSILITEFLEFLPNVGSNIFILYAVAPYGVPAHLLESKERQYHVESQVESHVFVAPNFEV